MRTGRQYIFCLLFLTALSSEAVGQDVKFHTDEWEEAKALARQENKLIFIDGYTTWCESCRLMDEYVFATEECGAFFNETFVNVRMNMEKGTGPLFVSRYNIRTYPVFLFLSWDGTLIHTASGYRDVESLIDLGEKALAPTTIKAAMESRFDDGDRIPAFLNHLTYVRMNQRDPAYKELIPLYLETQENWNTEENLEYIFDVVYDIDSDLFKHMANNKLDYGIVVGADSFNQKFNRLLHRALKNDGKPISLERRAYIYELSFPLHADQMITEYKLDYYTDLSNDSMYAHTALYYYQNFAMDDSVGMAKDMNLIVKYVKTEDSKDFVLNYFTTIAQKENSPDAWLQLARYQLKIDNFEEAKELGKKAKKLAGESNLKKKPYRQFLKEVRRAKRRA